MYICVYVQRSVVRSFPFVYTVALLVIKQATKEDKSRAADQGVWALKASGYTIDFCFALHGSGAPMNELPGAIQRIRLRGRGFLVE